MFSWTIELGQLIVASLIAIIGFLFKKSIVDRIDRHDEQILDLISRLERLIGFMAKRDGYEAD